MVSNPNEVQKLLIAFNINGFGSVIAAIGEQAKEEIDIAGSGIEDLGFGGWPDDSPGLHTWIGKIRWDSWNDEPDIHWEGEWRRAIAEDLKMFSVPIPE